MATWSELLDAFQAQLSDAKRTAFLTTSVRQALEDIATLRQAEDGKPRNVLVYASAFLQKPHAPAASLSISHEDLDALMATIHGMTWANGLTLVLHTPGGGTNATESIVAYLRSKFDYIEVIVPTFAMSAGTMISLACDRIVMGRQSQLGPIDPQMVVGGRSLSARAVVDQFERARREIVGDGTPAHPGDVNQAHLWAPILASIGPALLLEAQNALDYSERMVAEWAAQYMLGGDTAKAASIAAHFNDASKHLSHGRRIDRDEARREGVIVEDLEASQDLQEAVLTLHHLGSIIFQSSPATKFFESTTGARYVKNWGPPEDVVHGAAPARSPLQVQRPKDPRPAKKRR